MSDDDLPPLPASLLAAFKEALDGGKGDLDAWLEVNDEAEVRSHVHAYARAAVEAERERCARVCDEQHDRARTSTGASRASACAAAIRGAK